jgi:cholesterol oxidase
MAAEYERAAAVLARPDHREGLLYLFAAMRSFLNPKGLYNYFMSDQAHVLTASGVGGGSLIYSNVNLAPEEDIYAGWPIALDGPAYDDARQWMIKSRGQLHNIVTKSPITQSVLKTLGVSLADLKDHKYLYMDRVRALKEAAEAVAKDKGVALPWAPLDLSVIEFDEDQDPGGSVKQHTFCERQGRCMLGCLPQARHTLNKTIYGKFFQQNKVNVELWSLTEVTSVAADPAGGYRVSFNNHGEKDHPNPVTAQRVFFAAGCLGTTELLLRCHKRDKTLKLSDLIGHGFSTNGDFAGFVVGTNPPVYSGRGPINMSHVKYSYLDGARKRHITIEDAGVPKMLGPYVKTALEVLDNVVQREVFKGRMTLAWNMKISPDLGSLLPTIPHTEDPNSYQTEDEMLSDIFFFNCMGADDANGRFDLDGLGNLTLKWDTPVANQTTFQKTEELLRALGEKMGGRYTPFPLWKGFSNKKLVTTHPLGGCHIGTDRGSGVVNAKGQLFDASKPDPTAVYDGLYVLDGSIIPNALAVNPTLTIAALALKIMAQVT